MSLRLPPSSSPVRELVDVAQLATLGDSAEVRKLPTYREAINGARSFLSNEAAAKFVASLVLRANGELWLVRISRKSAQRLWNFGKVCA